MRLAPIIVACAVSASSAIAGNGPGAAVFDECIAAAPGPDVSQCFSLVSDTCIGATEEDDAQRVRQWCYLAETRLWRRMMRDDLVKLRDALPVQALQSFELQQQYWIAGATHDCAFPYSHLVGAAAAADGMRCTMRRTQNRAAEIRKFLGMVDDCAFTTRAARQGDCQ